MVRAQKSQVGSLIKGRRKRREENSKEKIPEKFALPPKMGKEASFVAANFCAL